MGWPRQCAQRGGPAGVPIECRSRAARPGTTAGTCWCRGRRPAAEPLERRLLRRSARGPGPEPRKSSREAAACRGDDERATRHGSTGSQGEPSAGTRPAAVAAVSPRHAGSNTKAGVALSPCCCSRERLDSALKRPLQLAPQLLGAAHVECVEVRAAVQARAHRCRGQEVGGARQWASRESGSVSSDA